MSEKRRRESMLKAHAVGDGAAVGMVGRVGSKCFWALENASFFVHFRSDFNQNSNLPDAWQTASSG